ncbi:MAG: hypothetical protein ACRD2S_04350 [Terriglobales bacterium]
MRTLLAGVQFETALRATPNWVGNSRQYRSALTASRYGMRARKL